MILTIESFIHMGRNVDNEFCNQNLWRKYQECASTCGLSLTAIQCDGGSVYMACGPTCENTCRTPEADLGIGCSDECVEGCFCPPGTYKQGKHYGVSLVAMCLSITLLQYICNYVQTTVYNNSTFVRRL